MCARARAQTHPRSNGQPVIAPDAHLGHAPRLQPQHERQRGKGHGHDDGRPGIGDETHPAAGQADERAGVRACVRASW
jgi:hypothetical protein